MSLDISRLENVRTRGARITARCPACTESGHDKRGEHLIMDDEGRFACVVYPGDSADAKEHRKRIFALSGNRQLRPLCVSPASVPLGRLGRVADSPSGVAPFKTGLLGRLGRLFHSHIAPQDATAFVQSPGPALSEFQTPVLSVPKPLGTVKPDRPLTDQELLLLRQAGMENDPVVITALNLFQGPIVALVSNSTVMRKQSECSERTAPQTTLLQSTLTFLKHPQSTTARTDERQIRSTK